MCGPEQPLLYENWTGLHWQTRRLAQLMKSFIQDEIAECPQGWIAVGVLAIVFLPLAWVPCCMQDCALVCRVPCNIHVSQHMPVDYAVENLPFSHLKRSRHRVGFLAFKEVAEIATSLR